MSPNGASFAFGAPPMTAPGYVPPPEQGCAPGRPARSAKHGARPLTTPWPTTLDAVSVPWPSMPGSKSPLQASISPGPNVKASRNSCEPSVKRMMPPGSTVSPSEMK